MSPLSESYCKILRNREPHYIEPYEDGLRVNNSFFAKINNLKEFSTQKIQIIYNSFFLVFFI